MMKSIARLISNNIALIVLLVAIAALIFPEVFSVVKTSYINVMLGLVMFGMGLTLNFGDFKIVFMRPKDVIVGCLAQFTVMPAIAWTLSKVFGLEPGMAIGVVLVGCCPGGTASNVIAYLAKGDLALSVGMTSVSTIIAPFLTPLLTYLLAGNMIDVNIMDMFVSIVQVVIMPIAVGFVVKHYFSELTNRATEYLPMFSTMMIAAIVAGIVAANASKLMSVGMLILLVVVLHNMLGLVLGYVVGIVMRLPLEKRISISVEVGMQNSGLASSLAALHFGLYPLATVPGALFSVWHNISGAIMANIYRRMYDHNKKRTSENLSR